MFHRIFGVLIFAVSIFSMGFVQAENKLQSSMDTSLQTQQQGKESQAKIDRLAAQQQALLSEYQSLLKKSEYQKAYNQELRTLEKEQIVEISSLEQQIKDIAITKQQLLPLLREMVQTLEQFVKLDLPFRQQQRLTSIDKLSRLLSTSSVSISEKYRRVMEFYQAENDYNYDLEVYRDDIMLTGESLSVQVLRIGRSNLYMQTMDASISAMWDREKKQWVRLDNKQQLNIRKAIRIASKKAAPELLSLPYATSLESASNVKGQ